MPKYIRFEQVPVPLGGQPAYRIVNKRCGDLLGAVLWYPPWRQYVFQCSDSAAWSADCLADVQAFMQSLSVGERTNE